jgi:hypothetical protein
MLKSTLFFKSFKLTLDLCITKIHTTSVGLPCFEKLEDGMLPDVIGR